MHEHHDATTGMHRFEKNNYFYGKLLTVRDMAAEQAYHSSIQRALSRYVTGHGSVCGLAVDSEVRTDETGNDSLAVTVGEGLALDRCGRLVVVEDEVHREVPLDGGFDTVSVYVQWDECYRDPVPAAKMENACEDDCEDNRIVEIADISLEPGPPDPDPDTSVAEVSFPTAADLGIAADDPTNPPVVDLVEAPEGELELPQTVTVLTGKADVEVGTGLDISVRSGGAFVDQAVATVDDSNRYAATFDFSPLAVGDGVRVEVQMTGRRSPFLQSYSGFVVEIEEPDGADDPADVDEDHVLAGPARSYYVSEPRAPCPPTDDGPVLLGTLTRPEGGSWGAAAFERGPLVYSNDLLYDTLVRHASDFENPHEVALDVAAPETDDGAESATDGDVVSTDGSASSEDVVSAGAAVGVYEPGGPTGTIGLTSTDASVAITPGPRTVDFSVSSRALLDEYYVFEKSLWNTANSALELAQRYSEYQQQNRNHDFGLAGIMISLTLQLAIRVIHGLDDVDDTPQSYITFLTSGPSVPTNSPLDSPFDFVNKTIVELERTMLDVVVGDADPQTHVPLRLYDDAVSELETAVENPSDRTALLRVGVAQDRVAEAMMYVAPVDQQPPTEADEPVSEEEEVVERRPMIREVLEDNQELLMTEADANLLLSKLRVGAATDAGGEVPDLVGKSTKEAVGILDDGNWSYRIESQPVPDTRMGMDTAVDRVTSQQPAPSTVVGPETQIELAVAAAPGTKRIDGIGSTRQERLRRAGIETLSQLAVADIEKIAAAANVSDSLAADWQETAQVYSDAYALTEFEGIGVNEAEALARSVSISSKESLAAESAESITSKLQWAVDEGNLDEDIAEALFTVDWQTTLEGLRS